MRYGALAMTEHAGTTAAVTTAATNRVRVRMLGICRKGLTCRLPFERLWPVDPELVGQVLKRCERN